MKNTAIITLSVLFLAACTSTSNYNAVVSTESHTEVYETETLLEPVSPITDATQNSVETGAIVNNNQAIEDVEASATAQASMTIAGVCDNQEMVMVNKDDLANLPKFNSYLIQVISVQEQSKATGIEEYAKKLPSSYSKWKHNKVISGQEWSTLLIGEFASAAEARTALTSLSTELTTFSPFVVSVKKIQCSGSPSLIKLP